MALQPILADDLAGTSTVLASFMGRGETRYKTVGQLLEIYRERKRGLSAEQDLDDNLRVDRFARDMASSRWRSSVVVRIGVFDGTVLVIDGIHRAIAYLSCLASGIGAEQLPALHVER
jgi:hypothetical protein